MSASGYASRVKRLVDHRPECMFRDEENPDEFYVAGGTLRRDALGRKGGSTWTWQTYTCNDPDCPGTVMVRGDVLKDLIAEALDAAS